MQPVNTRLAYMNGLVDLIKQEQSEYNHFRGLRAPEMSIHGKDQNIKVKFHIGNEMIGELTLFCPKSDQWSSWQDAQGWFDVLKAVPEWRGAVMNLAFRQYTEVRDYWASIDILTLMALQQFRIEAIGETHNCVYAGGRLISGDNDYGRFLFKFDVTRAYCYFQNRGEPDKRVYEGYTLVDGAWTKPALDKVVLDPNADLLKLEVGIPTEAELEKANHLIDSRAKLEAIDNGYSELIDNEEMQADMAAVVDEAAVMHTRGMTNFVIPIDEMPFIKHASNVAQAAEEPIRVHADDLPGLGIIGAALVANDLCEVETDVGGDLNPIEQDIVYEQQQIADKKDPIVIG